MLLQWALVVASLEPCVGVSLIFLTFSNSLHVFPLLNATVVCRRACRMRGTPTFELD